MTEPEQTIWLLERLVALGLTDRQFRTWHHRGTSIVDHIEYCRGRTRLDHGSNRDLLEFLRRELNRRENAQRH